MYSCKQTVVVMSKEQYYTLKDFIEILFESTDDYNDILDVIGAINNDSSGVVKFVNDSVEITI